MLEQGRQLHMEGRLGEAAAVYQKILKKDPRNSEALHLLGVVSLQNEDFPQAIRLIRDAIAIAGENPDYLNNLGQALYGAGDLFGALESYRRALKGNPRHPDVLNNLGITLYDLDRLEEAREAYEAALALEASGPDLLHNYGVLMQAMGDLEKARESYLEALRLEPRMEHTHLSLGSVFNEEGNKEAAIRGFQAAVELNPFYVEAHEALKMIYWDLGQQDRMDDSYYRASELLPQSSEIHCNLGKALNFSQKLVEAEKALNRALALDAENAEAHSELGCLYTKQKKFDEALAEHQEAVRLDGRNPFFREEWGNTLSIAGDFKQAVGVIEKAHELHPRRSSILGALTIAMNETGDARVSEIIDIDEFLTTRFLEVPDGFDDLDAFNEALHAELEAMHTDHPEPPGQTMKGGTQIPGGLFTGPTGLTAVLKEKISKALSEYIDSLEKDPDHPFLRYLNPDFRFTGAWSTILHGSGYDDSHIHNEGWISGVYYIKVPDLPEDRWQAGEGCIQFGEPPSMFVSERNKAQRVVRPIPGMAVFFPSYYWHGVRPFEKEAVRHSMAFDVI
ncbi:MAG: tetratricopeptide repeat protein [Proteobacteria bacterium]|nr:tetratricopeptide repeat protein [Pseudomonadota bacterium]